MIIKSKTRRIFVGIVVVGGLVSAILFAFFSITNYIENRSIASARATAEHEADEKFAKLNIDLQIASISQQPNISSKVDVCYVGPKTDLFGGPRESCYLRYAMAYATGLTYSQILEKLHSAPVEQRLLGSPNQNEEAYSGSCGLLYRNYDENTVSVSYESSHYVYPEFCDRANRTKGASSTRGVILDEDLSVKTFYNDVVKPPAEPLAYIWLILDVEYYNGDARCFDLLCIAPRGPRHPALP